MITGARRLWNPALALLVVGAVGACGSSQEETGSRSADRGDVVLSWQTAADPAVQALASSMQETALLQQIADGLNTTFWLPRDLPVAHVSCGKEKASYEPSQGGVSLCYELLAAVARIAYTPMLTDEEIGERVLGTWTFVLFHELGHALRDIYELPLTGKEEDAVDDFATLLLIKAGLADYALRAAEYWSSFDPATYDELAYADEHSLSAQRFYTIVCVIYGSDPTRYATLVSSGVLPENRAQRCPAEYVQKVDSWSRLLQPWLK